MKNSGNEKKKDSETHLVFGFVLLPLDAGVVWRDVAGDRRHVERLGADVGRRRDVKVERVAFRSDREGEIE